MKGKKKVKEPAGMNIPEIFAALAMLEKERGIPQTFMMDKIIQAVTTAYKRDHKDVENVIVDVDEEHQRLKMYVQKNVVAEEDYVDPFNEIPVEEAKTISARYEIGDVVNIPAGVKHWHGAQKDCWFSHIAVECPGEETSNEWCEPVTDAEYAALDADCAQNP